MKTRKKGNRNRRKAIELLESEGFLVDIVEKTGKFVKQKDLFGLWDLMAIKRLPEYTEVRLVQVKSNTKPTMKPFRQFKEEYGDAFSCEVWIWKDRKGFTKWIL